MQYKMQYDKSELHFGGAIQGDNKTFLFYLFFGYIMGLKHDIVQITNLSQFHIDSPHLSRNMDFRRGEIKFC